MTALLSPTSNPGFVERRKQPLSNAVRVAMDLYFQDLNDGPPGNLYHMVIHEVERPLLEAVMRHAQGNQSQAAKILGINRATLRKKLAEHGLMKTT